MLLSRLRLGMREERMEADSMVLVGMRFLKVFTLFLVARCDRWRLKLERRIVERDRGMRGFEICMFLILRVYILKNSSLRN